jgi:extracellular elastinolytic metalloproteinase
MAREVDVRAAVPPGADPRRDRERAEDAAQRVSASLPGSHELRLERIDPVTGNAAMVGSVDAPAEAGRYVQRALEHVQHIAEVIGLAADQPPEFVADPHVQRTTTGAHAVNLQQLYKGIPIYDATRTVVFGPTGAIEATFGTTVTVAEDHGATPTLSVQEAVRRAAEYVTEPEEGAVDQFGEALDPPRVELAGWQPELVASFGDDPSRAAVFAAGPFADEIKAALIWFPLGDDLRLAWEVQITLPNNAGRFRTLVDAEDGRILLCASQIAAVRARGNIYRLDPAHGRQMLDFPAPVANYGVPLPSAPPGFPDPWVEADSTVGNSVYAGLGDTGRTYRVTPAGGYVTFDPPAAGDDQKLLNIFFFNCVLHDFFYLLGFTEREGNFQKDNYGRGGTGNDRVDARAYRGAVSGTASMDTPAQGSPIMRMGLVTSTNRHTALDSSVVFHEYMHGVTTRLVGGRTATRNLEAPQSRGMGEGWSDYNACTLTGSDVIGAWVVDRPEGIRSHAYDDAYPKTFADLPTMTDEHDVGEVWAAALLALNRALGVRVTVQLVIDALKLTVANPSFLDGRDAILLALRNERSAQRLDEQQYAAALNGAWRVFAHYGLGPEARTNGAFLDGVVADFTPPPDVGAEPGPGQELAAGTVDVAG